MEVPSVDLSVRLRPSRGTDGTLCVCVCDGVGDGWCVWITSTTVWGSSSECRASPLDPTCFGSPPLPHTPGPGTTLGTPLRTPP